MLDLLWVSRETNQRLGIKARSSLANILLVKIPAAFLNSVQQLGVTFECPCRTPRARWLSSNPRQEVEISTAALSWHYAEDEAYQSCRFPWGQRRTKVCAGGDLGAHSKRLFWATPSRLDIRQRRGTLLCCEAPLPKRPHTCWCQKLRSKRSMLHLPI